MTKKIIAATFLVLLALAAHIPANANETASTTNSGLSPRERLINERALSKTQTDSAKDRASKEIDNRIEVLSRLNDRVSSMKRVSESVKKNISDDVKTNIGGLKSLKEKIENGSDSAVALENGKSIAKDYRIYNLVVPRGYIVASADRIATLSEKMKGLADKLAAKIAQLKAAGKDTAALESQLTEMNAKINDAITSSESIQRSVASLMPDQGGKNVAVNNRDALTEAREDIRKATENLKKTKLEANRIAQQIRKMGGMVSSGYGSASSTIEK